MCCVLPITCCSCTILIISYYKHGARFINENDVRFCLRKYFYMVSFVKHVLISTVNPLRYFFINITSESFHLPKAFHVILTTNLCVFLSSLHFEEAFDISGALNREENMCKPRNYITFMFKAAVAAGSIILFICY